MSGFADRQGIAPGSAACRLALAALMLLVGGSLALAANAVHLIQGDQNERTLQSDSPPAGQELSRAQAIALVQRRYHARVVRSALQQDRSGRRVYVLRLLSAGGKVWSVRIDAHSGAELP